MKLIQKICFVYPPKNTLSHRQEAYFHSTCPRHVPQDSQGAVRLYISNCLLTYIFFASWIQRLLLFCILYLSFQISVMASNFTCTSFIKLSHERFTAITRSHRKPLPSIQGLIKCFLELIQSTRSYVSQQSLESRLDKLRKECKESTKKLHIDINQIDRLKILKRSLLSKRGTLCKISQTTLPRCLGLKKPHCRM